MTAFFFAAGGQNVLKEVVNLNDNVTSTCRWVGHPWNIASICQDPRSSQAWWTQNYTLRFKQLDNLLSAHWLSLKVTAFNNLLPLWMTGFSKGWSDCFHWSNDHSFCSQAGVYETFRRIVRDTFWTRSCRLNSRCFQGLLVEVFFLRLIFAKIDS